MKGSWNSVVGFCFDFNMSWHHKGIGLVMVVFGSNSVFESRGCQQSNCPLTGEWKKKNVYEDNGIVLDYKKKLNTNIYYNVKDPQRCHIK